MTGLDPNFVPAKLPPVITDDDAYTALGDILANHAGRLIELATPEQLATVGEAIGFHETPRETPIESLVLIATILAESSELDEAISPGYRTIVTPEDFVFWLCETARAHGI